MARVKDQLLLHISVLADKEADEPSLLEAAKHSAVLVSKQSVDPDVYTNLCLTLIDVVLPRIDEQSEHLLTAIYDVFLSGIPSISFFLLSSSLSSSSTSPSLEKFAQAIIYFVSDHNRISYVISKPHNTDIVNHLLHLPSKISNILVSHSSNNQLLDEDVYFSTLAEAIFTQSTTSDIQRDQILSELLARLVVMCKSETLISTFLSRALADPNSSLDSKVSRICSLIKKAPPSSMKQLTRALVEEETCKSEKLLVAVLSRLLSSNRAARNAALYEIPLRQPLLRNVRRATKRLIQSISRKPKFVQEGLMACAEMWSSDEFAHGADVMLQRQVTRLLLYFFRVSARQELRGSDADENDVMMVVVNGIQIRLNESDFRIRRHAMVVGEAASRHARDKEPLLFEREDEKEARRQENKAIGDDGVEDGGDSDYSDIAHGIGTERDDDSSEDETHVGDVEKTSEIRVDMNKQPNVRSKDTKKPPKTTYTWPESMEMPWEDEDDWQSPAEYESSSEDESGSGKSRPGRRYDVSTLRDKLPAPMSVGRLLDLLREMNGSDSGAVTVKAEEASAAMRLIGSQASELVQRTGALRSAAGSICLELLRFEAERYPDDFVKELLKIREEALISVIQLDVTTCGTDLVNSVICGGTADISRRLYALSVLSQAVTSQDREQVKKSSTTKRHFDPISSVRQAEGLTQVFRLLVEGVCAGAGADFIQPDGQDCRVWAQALITLAVLAEAAGKATHGRWMRAQLMDVVVNRVVRINGEPVVRRAIALTMGAVFDGMADEELSKAFVEKADIVLLQHEREESDVPSRCIEWLREASENDADIGVRRFAVISIRKLAARIDTLS